MEISTETVRTISVLLFSSVCVISFLFAKKDVAAPSVMFPLIFSLYWCAPNLGNRSYSVDATGEIRYIIFGVGVLSAFYLGCIIASKINMKNQTSDDGENDKMRYLGQGALVFILLILPFYLFTIINVMKAVLRGSSYQLLVKSMEESVVFGHPIIFIIIGSVIVFYATGKRTVLFLAGISFVVCFLAGERGVIATTLPSLLLVIHYKYFKMRRPVFFLMLAVLVVSACIYGSIRAWMTFGNIYFLKKFFLVIQQSPDLLNPFNAGEFYNVAVPSKLLIADGVNELNYGKSFLQGIFRLLPFVGKQMNLNADAGSYIVDKYSIWLLSNKEVGGIGGALFGIEGLFAFGFTGTLLQALVTGVGSGLFHKWADNNRGKCFPVIVYAILYPVVVISFVRISFSSTVMALFKQYLLPLFFGYFWVLLTRDLIRIKNHMYTVNET